MKIRDFITKEEEEVRLVNQGYKYFYTLLCLLYKYYVYYIYFILIEYQENVL